MSERESKKQLKTDIADMVLSMLSQAREADTEAIFQIRSALTHNKAKKTAQEEDNRLPLIPSADIFVAEEAIQELTGSELLGGKSTARVEKQLAAWKKDVQNAEQKTALERQQKEQNKLTQKKKRIVGAKIAASAMAGSAILGGITYGISAHIDANLEDKIHAQQQHQKEIKQQKNERISLDSRYLGTKPSKKSELGWTVQLAPNLKDGAYKDMSNSTSVMTDYAGSLTDEDISGAFVRISNDINDIGNTGITLSDYNYLDGTKKGIKISIYEQGIDFNNKELKKEEFLLKDKQPILLFKNDIGEKYFLEFERNQWFSDQFDATQVKPVQNG